MILRTTRFNQLFPLHDIFDIQNGILLLGMNFSNCLLCFMGIDKIHIIIDTWIYATTPPWHMNYFHIICSSPFTKPCYMPVPLEMNRTVEEGQNRTIIEYSELPVTRTPDNSNFCYLEVFSSVP